MRRPRNGRAVIPASVDKDGRPDEAKTTGVRDKEMESEKPREGEGAAQKEQGQEASGDYWRTHTVIRGQVCELDVGMVEHLTAEGKTLRYSVGIIK